MDRSNVIGIDIGGSHITASVIDLKKREVIQGSVQRKQVNAKGSAATIITKWTDTINELYAGFPACERKIGIAMPGPFDYEKGICLISGVDKFESLYGLNIKELLAEKTGTAAQDILLTNDASCFLRGEIFSGAAVGQEQVAGITLGTGLGSARFHHPSFHEGFLYRQPYKNGTAEDYISTRWFLKRYKQETGQSAINVKELALLVQDNPVIQQLFEEFGSNLGQVLHGYLQEHPVNTIVIGGNLAKCWPLFINKTMDVFSQSQTSVEIRKAVLGEEGAMIGAASLWGTA